MITIGDIEKTLETYSFEDLSNMYDRRQKESVEANESVCKDFIKETGLEDTLKIFGETYSHKFKALLTLFLNSKRLDLVKTLMDMLDDYSYNNKSELLLAIQIFDSYYLKKISFELLSKALIGLTTTKDFNIQDGNQLYLKTDYGNTKILNPSKILKTRELEPALRHHQCHYVTCAYLYNFPKLYGAYYYIPNYFKGSIEHSVLFDYERGLVYDMANNAAIPLEFFLKYYPNYAFLINGEEFIDLNEQSEAKFHETLDMARIEQIRRVRKKQG